jgi:hypothetical protein
VVRNVVVAAAEVVALDVVITGVVTARVVVGWAAVVEAAP